MKLVECRLKHRGRIGIFFTTMLIIAGVFLFLMEAPDFGVVRIREPRWYRTLKRTLPGGEDREQRERIRTHLRAMKSNGIDPTPDSKASFTGWGKDIWRTPFRCEYRLDSLVVISAGPDKKFYTKDDRIYPQ